MKQRRRKQSYMGQMINTSVANMAGIGLIGASAGMAQALPACTPGRELVNTAVGMQGLAMLGPNVKFAKDSLGVNESALRRRRVRRARRVRY